MTTYQALIYTVVHAFTLFLPVSVEAHQWLLSHSFNWPLPGPTLSGLMALGGFSALLFYYLHDWGGIVIGSMRMIALRNRPRTLDERMPFFLLLSMLPLGIAWTYAHPLLESIEVSPFWLAGCLAGFSLPLLLAHRLNRKTKTMLNWNWLDSIVVGLAQTLILIPGAGRQVGALTAAFFRNYNVEATIKFCFLSFTPILAAQAYLSLSGEPIASLLEQENISWLTASATLLVSFFASLIAIGGFIRSIQNGSLKSYIAYRWIIALAILVLYWFKGAGE